VSVSNRLILFSYNVFVLGFSAGTLMQLFVCLPSSVGSLLSTGSELVKVTGSKLSSWLCGSKKENKKSVFCIVFRNMMLKYEMWSVPHTNE